MITTFENKTSSLTPLELACVPAIVEKLNEGDTLNAHQLASWLLSQGKSHLLITGPRMRQIIHYIRINKIVNNLIAKGRGYKIAADDDEVKEYKKSLQQRINSMKEILNSFD